MSTVISASTMPWQHVWGANLVGATLVILALWMFAQACWPEPSNRSEEDADA